MVRYLKGVLVLMIGVMVAASCSSRSGEGSALDFGQGQSEISIELKPHDALVYGGIGVSLVDGERPVVLLEAKAHDAHGMELIGAYRVDPGVPDIYVGSDAPLPESARDLRGFELEPEDKDGSLLFVFKGDLNREENSARVRVSYRNADGHIQYQDTRVEYRSAAPGRD